MKQPIAYRDERDKPMTQREIEHQERFNSARLNAERIAKISESCHIQTNSCNIFLGPSGCGKSASMFVELIEMLSANPNIHCVIYVNKEGDIDATFREFKDEIESMAKLIIVREIDFVKVSQLILKYKQLYNDIKDDNLEDLIVDEQMEQIYETLGIDSFDKDHLSTVLLMPDGANSILFHRRERSKDAPVRNYFMDFLLKERRHRDVGYTILVCVQNIKDIPTDIRSNTDTWFLFSGYPIHDISLVRQYLPSTLSNEDLLSLYGELGSYEKLIFSKHHRDFPIISR
jgi:hypothetical protein